MSPLTWYTQGNRFDLSPGYGEQNRHFERAISDGCVQCHVGRVRQEAQAANTFLTPAFDEVAIGCERCHGPAGRHVTYRLDPAQELSPSLTPEVEAARRQELREGDPIINPTQLGPEERESVCNQCHLTGGERVLQYGRTEYDFRPGQHLGDVWAIYTRGDGIQAGGRTEAVGQVEQMRASVCFQSSAGRFGCTSCHDPHTIPTQGERTEFYRSKCLNCHSGAQSTCSLNEAERLQRVADDSCIACHMPRLSASDVPHTAQTDHRVLRIPVQKPFSANTEQPYRLFGDLAEKLSAPEQDRAEGILMSRVATELKDIWLAEQATLKLQGVTLPADDVEGWLALADAYSTQNRPGLAEEIWKRLLVDQPNEERALKSLAISHHNTGRVQEASDLFDRYFNIRPRDRQIAGRSVHVLGQTSQWVRAIQRAEQTVALYPWDWQLQGWLAEAYQTQGKLDAAETPLRILRTIKPPNP